MLTPQEKEQLGRVVEQFPFRATEYYLSLIRWDDPEDPIRRLIVPSVDELEDFGRLDPSEEQAYTVLPGLEHKYNSTVVLLTCDICGGICRYCFRKRLFLNPRKETLQDIPAALDYIRSHPEITNVLVTGGDPLILGTGRLEKIIMGLREIEHVQIVRIGTRMPVFNPYRILDDTDFLCLIDRFSTPQKKIYIMNHFSHPRELTPPAIHALDLMQRAGAILTNQCPLIRGVNDDPDVLAELWRKLSFFGAVPYYLFQCRPALGNRTYTVPIEQGYKIVERAKSQVSGLAKRLRYVMSHATGKIEIVGLTEKEVFMKYHRAATESDNGRFMVLRRNSQAYWLDDYDEILSEYAVSMPYRAYGPE
jgi:KamA family protein